MASRPPRHAASRRSRSLPESAPAASPPATPQPPSPDDLYLMEAAAAEGARAAAQGVALLLRLGWPAQRPVPLGLLLALSAVMRLYQWEQADLVRHLRSGGNGSPLPAAEQVLLSFLAGTPERRSYLNDNCLAREVFELWSKRMAWRPPVRHADVLIKPRAPGSDSGPHIDLAGEAALDLLTRLLWSLCGRGSSTAGNR